MAFNREALCSLAEVKQQEIKRDNQPTTYTLFDCKSCKINMGWVGGTPSEIQRNVDFFTMDNCKKLNNPEV